MLVYLIRRLGQSLLVVAVMATFVFLAVYAVGDPIDILASPDADQIERDAIARRLGLDRPLYEQFAGFVWRALHGDLGRSFVYNVPAVEVILQRLPATVCRSFYIFVSTVVFVLLSIFIVISILEITIERAAVATEHVEARCAQNVCADPQTTSSPLHTGRSIIRTVFRRITTIKLMSIVSPQESPSSPFLSPTTVARARQFRLLRT